MPCSRSPTAHQIDTPAESSAMRHAAAHAAPTPTAPAPTRRSKQRMTSQSPGATIASSRVAALMLPAARVTSANSAGSRHPPRSTARIVSPTSHGRAAHARRSTESRAVNASWNGVSMYTKAPASAPVRRTPSNRNSQRAPSTATSEIEPSQNLCATHTGIPNVWVSQ